MRKIPGITMMFGLFAAPLVALNMRIPPNNLNVIESVDVNDICVEPEVYEYAAVKIEPVYVSIDQTESETSDNMDISLSDNGFDEKLLNDRSEIHYEFDNLLDTDCITDPSYYGCSYALTDEERSLVERTVMCEAGWNPDYRILILTAQCFRNDCEIFETRPSETFKECGYYKMSYANPRAVKAVHEVFDLGVRCVPEKIFCYYNSNMVSSPYHESNQLAIDIDGNRFFY